MHLDFDDDIVLSGFGIAHEHVEIAIICKSTRVEQFVLELTVPSAGVFCLQILVRKRLMWILVKHLHITVRRRVVEIKVILFDVLAVIALGAGEPKQTFFENGIVFVPKGEGKTQILIAVADASEAVFVPTVCPAVGVFKGKILPRVARGTVVFAHRTPCPFAQVRPPVTPVGAVLPVLEQLLLFGSRFCGVFVLHGLLPAVSILAVSVLAVSVLAVSILAVSVLAVSILR